MRHLLDECPLCLDLVAENRAAQERIFAIIKQEKDRGVSETKIRKEAEVFRDLAARIKAEGPESKTKSTETVAAAIESQAVVLGDGPGISIS